MTLMRFVGAGALLSLVVSCSGPGDVTSEEGHLNGYKTGAAAHKVQVSSEHAALAIQQGAKVLGDYGSFKLLEVDEATMPKLASVPTLEVRDEYNLIRLNAGDIDTASPHGASLRGMTLPASGKAFHLVQFAGPIQPEWYFGLEATGVQVVTYIPNNAYLVYGDAKALTALQQFTAAQRSVQWDGAYLNDYKLDPSVAKMETGAYSIQLIKDVEANAATLAAINQMKTREGVTQEALGYVNVVAYMGLQSAYQLALRPDVVSIQPYFEPKMRDERQDMIISGNLTGTNPTGPGYLAWLGSKGFTQAQFTASGFGVDVSDSGLDNATPAAPNHFGLYINGDVTGTSRVVYARLVGTPHSGGTIQGCDGHGTLNSHIIAGFSNQSAAPFVDATGFHYGLGVAPFVKVGSSVVFDPNTFTSPNYENLQSQAYNDGMRISSNSWGAATSSYTSDSQRYDALVRDAQPSGSTFPTAGNQEMIIVFAAGNGGPGAGSVGSPGTGKNVITAGGSENVHPFGAADQCGVADTDANSALDMAFFASRGPTSDGRKKPELVAPATHVSGGVFQTVGQHANPPANPLGSADSCFDAGGVCAGPGTSNFWPVGQQWYTASSGTSHSTPAIAGAAALVRQYFINQGMTPPSPAMTKAYLANSARYMTGSGANDNLYSNNQGMGLLDVGNAFNGVPRVMRDEVAADLFTATGQTRTFNGAIADSSKPFRVTLAWTDAPGSTTGSAWKNNLDLTVTVGGNTYLGNVFTGANSVTGGTADLSNNMESVFLPAGLTGNFTITVTAANINSDGVPGNASPLDQDFALVINNACNSAPPAPTGLATAVGGPNRVDLTWSATGGNSFNIYRSFTAGGPYTLVGNTTNTTYSDTTVSGGSTYFYVVRGVQCAESPNSNESSVTATGVCTLPPDFAGLTAATNGAAATCANNLTWSAATARCGGTITYSVYRSTTSGFAPAPSNRIMSGVSGTTFADNLNLANGTAYYYVVRAVEVAAATAEDTNTVEKTATPTGGITPAINYFDDMDGNRPPNANAYWIPTTISGSNGLSMVSGCHFQSSNTAWRFGSGATTCGGSYANSTQNLLKLGGNGSVAGINGFAFPASSTGTMTFNIGYMLENAFDGAQLVYSTTGVNGTYNLVPDTVTAGQPYITAGGYDRTVVALTGRVWSGTAAGFPANGALKAVSVNLDALAGQTVHFGFRFGTDSSVVFEGMYVDDVRITSNIIGSCNTNVPPPGPAVAYRVAGLPASVGAGTATPFTVTAYDSRGVTATGYTGTAAFTSTDAQATLPPNATFVAGVANPTITFKTLGTQSVTATDVADATITGRASTTITAGPPAAVAFKTQPTTAVAGVGITPAVQVQVVDQFGNLVNTSTASVDVALGNNAGGGTLSGTTTVAAVAGVATFPGLSIDKIGTGYTLAASSAGLTGATSAAFDITPAADASLRIRTQPTNTVAGIAINPAVVVEVLDSFGNLTNSNVPVSFNIANNPGGGFLFGTPFVQAVNGVATFNDLRIDKVGSGYTLTATAFDPNVTDVTTTGFDITPNVPYYLDVTGQPSNTVAGAPITPGVQVTVRDQYNNVATNSAIPVLMTLFNNPYNAKLSGTKTVIATGGVANFMDISIDKAGAGYALFVNSTGVYGSPTVGFDVLAAPAAQLAFGGPVGDATAGQAIPSVTVVVQDAFGNAISGATPTVTVAIGNNPVGGTLSGTTSGGATGGTVSFTDLSIDRAASGYTLTASAPGLADATSSSFAVTAGAAAQLAFAVGPSSVASGAAIAPAVKVAVQDALGNTVTSSSASITLAFGTNTAGGALAGTTSANAASGVATFSNLSVDKVGTGYTLVASSSGVTDATSSGFDVTAGAPARLVFSTQPVNTAAGVAIPSVAVTLQDAAGNTLTGSSASVTVGLAPNPAGAFLGGTQTVAAVNGVATFTTLTVGKAGTGYTLVASANGFASATSAAFNIGAAGAASYVISGLAASVAAGVETTFSVTAKDAFGNAITDYAGTATVTSSDGSAVLPSGNQTFSNGALNNVKVTFKSPGAQSVTVTNTTNSAVTATAKTNVTAFGLPVINVTSPADQDAVSGKVQIKATGTVAPGTTLSKISILVDGVVVGTSATADATVEWNTATVPNPSVHSITAQISDSAGNTALSVPVTVTVRRGCGCGAASGADASGVLALLAAGRALLSWRKRRQARR